MTSHDVVGKIRREFKLKKVGHAGTLDPLATGVLVVCVGNAARLSEYLMQTTKRYRAVVHLGMTTETYDMEGAVADVRDASRITRPDVEVALQKFLGEVGQTPPMYSAIKQGGRKLYELARAGETIEREARTVRIDALEVVEWSPPKFTLDITCSAGTYIRSLANDVGEALSVGAHLAGLVRLVSGSFKLENAVGLDTLLSNPNWQEYLVSPQSALADWPIIHLDDVSVDHIVHGRPITISTRVNADRAFAFGPDGRLVAIVQPDGGVWRPHKVFS